MAPKIMVFGDTHGYFHVWEKHIAATKHLDYAKIIQVGDFGIWDHIGSGVKYLDDLNALLSYHGRIVYAIGGNHENWTHWDWYVQNMPRDPDGFAAIRTHIRLAPRTHRWIWGTRKFYGIAGAVSVDRVLRNSEPGPRQSWWPREQITDAEIDAVPNYPVDFLFTHDCSNKTPWGFKLIPDFDSQIHRQRIDRALGKLTPEFHFHGHMHHKYDWENRVGGDAWTKTYGLAQDGRVGSWGLLDTVNKEFRWDTQGNL